VLNLPTADDVGMHLIDCPHCGRRELRGARNLHTVATPTGAVLASTCRACGAVVAASDSRLLGAPALGSVA
jgi:hypothetical protein